MITLPDSVKLYLCLTPVDMRKQFDGLANATRQIIRAEPLSGHLFVFFNRNRDLCKTIWWSSGGYCLFAKRLAKGKFILPDKDELTTILTPAELTLILEGIDLTKTKKHPRWNPKSS